MNGPDVVVAIERDGPTLRITTGISVDGHRPAPQTIREVGEAIRAHVDGTGDSGDSGDTDGSGATTTELISVTIRLVEGIGHTAGAAHQDVSEAVG